MSTPHTVRIPRPPPPGAPSTSIPGYQLPHLLETYSHLPSREIAHGTGPLAYYSSPPLGCDLNNGFESRIERDPRVEEHLDGLCEGLQRYALRKGGLKKQGLISWRGMFTRLLTAPYTDRDGWEMNALAFNGNVYLEDHNPLEKRLARMKQDSDPRTARFSYYGYAYESYSTVPYPPSTSSATPRRRTRLWTEDMNVNTNQQWCAIVKSKIGACRLFMGGEVDCFEGEWRKSMSNGVELKTNMTIQDSRGQMNFDRKLMKHWAQSVLLGIPTIEVGFRDKGGIVQHVERFETLRIPEIVRQRSPHNPLWNASHCLKTFELLASTIMREILPSDPIPPGSSVDDDELLPRPVLWRIKFEPGVGLSMRVTDDPFEGTEERWGFLQEGYVREMISIDRDGQEG